MPGQIPSRFSAFDAGLLLPVLALVGIGIVMVYSASSALAQKLVGTEYFFLKKQALFALLGIAALLACRYFPYRWYRPLTYPLLILAVGFLAAVHFSGVGYAAGGSTRWLRFGDIGFQPVEFARLALIIYLAYSMDKKGAHLKNFSIGFLPHMLVLAVFLILLFMQPDFGSVVIFGLITWIMLFVGGIRIMHLLTTLILILPAAYLCMINAAYRLKRLLSFLDPWQYPSDEGYQIIHSMMAFGTGGIWGTGIGNGIQKLFYLPEPHTDFIFSVIGEELGFVGIIVILALYGLILWRGVRIARQTDDRFGAYMAAGLTAAIMLQVCVNMGVAVGLLPTKGLTLPFLSYGGTSLLINMASVGILMNIGASPRTEQATRKPVQRTRYATA